MKTEKTAKRKRTERGIMKRWNDKPYHSLDYMLRERYGEKVYRVALNGGMSCPNRDGTLGKKGCIFCSQGGKRRFCSKRRPFHYRADQHTDQKSLFQTPDS